VSEGTHVLIEWSPLEEVAGVGNKSDTGHGVPDKTVRQDVTDETGVLNIILVEDGLNSGSEVILVRAKFGREASISGVTGGAAVNTLPIPTSIATNGLGLVNVEPGTLDLTGNVLRNGGSGLVSEPLGVVLPLGELVEVAVPCHGERSVGIVEPDVLGESTSTKSRISAVIKTSNGEVGDGHKIHLEVVVKKEGDRGSGSGGVGNRQLLGSVTEGAMSGGKGVVLNFAASGLTTDENLGTAEIVNRVTSLKVDDSTKNLSGGENGAEDVLQQVASRGTSTIVVDGASEGGLVLHRVKLVVIEDKSTTEPRDRVVKSDLTTGGELTVNVEAKMRIAAVLEARSSLSGVVGRLIGVAVSQVSETNVTLILGSGGDSGLVGVKDVTISIQVLSSLKIGRLPVGVLDLDVKRKLVARGERGVSGESVHTGNLTAINTLNVTTGEGVASEGAATVDLSTVEASLESVTIAGLARSDTIVGDKSVLVRVGLNGSGGVGLASVIERSARSLEVNLTTIGRVTVAIVIAVHALVEASTIGGITTPVVLTGNPGASLDVVNLSEGLSVLVVTEGRPVPVPVEGNSGLRVELILHPALKVGEHERAVETLDGFTESNSSGLKTGGAENLVVIGVGADMESSGDRSTVLSNPGTTGSNGTNGVGVASRAHLGNGAARSVVVAVVRTVERQETLNERVGRLLRVSVAVWWGNVALGVEDDVHLSVTSLIVLLKTVRRFLSSGTQVGKERSIEERRDGLAERAILGNTKERALHGLPESHVVNTVVVKTSVGVTVNLTIVSVDDSVVAKSDLTTVVPTLIEVVAEHTKTIGTALAIEVTLVDNRTE